MRVTVASAGTGKTTSLVLRYLELIAEGVPLRRIAGVTFTRAAAAELRERVREALRSMTDVGGYLGGLVRLEPHQRPRFEEALREEGAATLTTIHGFMIGALRLVAPSLGLDPDFRPLGEWEAVGIFEEEVRALALAEGRATDGRAEDREVERLLELFGQRSLFHEARGAGPAGEELLRRFERAYRRYRDRLGGRVLAPSEIEREALRLVGAPALAARVVSRSPVLLVDEYQDVNPLQGAVFERLEAAGARVEVVGDPKQSIYAFRHADVEVFRRAARAARAAGTLRPPLDVTRRHAPRVADVLNHLTSALAARGLGFGPEEAPAVRPAAAGAPGVVELHWVVHDTAALAELRAAEAVALAERLERWHGTGMPYGDMAVVARSRVALGLVRDALARRGVPVALRQGRGFFERLEVRDLEHALRVGVGGGGASLAAFLRGPFAALPPAAIETVMRSEDPERELRVRHPEVAGVVERVRAHVVGRSALRALEALAREPLAFGRPFVATLGAAARDNVDALLFEVAAAAPRDPLRLLDHLERRARDREAGDVPQSAGGVTLVTVHASKGLEWPLVAVFDAGAPMPRRRPEVSVDPHGGAVAATGDPGFAAAVGARSEAEEAEAFRQLYVAVSRARDVVIVTGSRGAAGRRAPWLHAFTVAGLGPGDDDAAARALGVECTVRRPEGGAPAGATAALPRAPLPRAAWTSRRFAPAPLPSVVSPSWVRVEGAGAAPPGASHAPAVVDPQGADDRVPSWWSVAADADGAPAVGPAASAAGLPAVGAVVGTLVHEAVARGWRPDGAGVRGVLEAQEVLWPFAPERRRRLVDEALELIRRYRALLDEGRLPALEDRDEDHAELPFALPDPRGGHVWHGVIDRVYRVGARWYLDDYKTDRRLDPDRYTLALAVYVRAFAAARGVVPEARLVDLRAGRIAVVPPAALGSAWAEVQSPLATT